MPDPHRTRRLAFHALSWAPPDGDDVLHAVTLDLDLSGIVVIAGPSGVGKSSLLRCVNRLEVPSAGHITLDGIDVASLEPTVLRRRAGMVFQRPTPFAGTVFDNLRVADPALTEADATALLATVALGDADLLGRDASALSGGEAQRMCLARTLATRPEVVLLDEPTSALDPAATLALETRARELAAGGVGIVWVTHDVAQLERLGDHVVILLDGAVAYTGDASGLAAAPAAVQAFLRGDTADQPTAPAEDGTETPT